MWNATGDTNRRVLYAGRPMLFMSKPFIIHQIARILKRLPNFQKLKFSYLLIKPCLRGSAYLRPANPDATTNRKRSYRRDSARCHSRSLKVIGCCANRRRPNLPPTAHQSVPCRYKSQPILLLLSSLVAPLLLLTGTTVSQFSVKGKHQNVSTQFAVLAVATAAAGINL